MEGVVGMGDSELVSKTLQIEHKLFYLDLKENVRGRYLKISEKASGSRSTIIVPLPGVVWFVDLFNYYANGADAELSSKELQLDTKVFYFDVGENNRGRFLKVSEASGMTRNRSTIIVPAGSSTDDGWAAFRNVLVEIHEASLALPLSGALPASLPPPAASTPQDVSQVYQGSPGVGASAEHVDNLPSSYIAPSPGSGAIVGGGQGSAGDTSVGGSDGGLVGSRVVRAEQKRFFFDLGANNRGQFLKISEVAGSDRSVIILPTSALEAFHEALGHFVELVKGQAPTGGGPNVRTIAPLRKRSDS